MRGDGLVWPLPHWSRPAAPVRVSGPRVHSRPGMARTYSASSGGQCCGPRELGRGDLERSAAHRRIHGGGGGIQGHAPQKSSDLFGPQTVGRCYFKSFGKFCPAAVTDECCRKSEKYPERRFFAFLVSQIPTVSCRPQNVIGIG